MARANRVWSFWGKHKMRARVICLAGSLALIASVGVFFTHCRADERPAADEVVRQLYSEVVRCREPQCVSTLLVTAPVDRIQHRALSGDAQAQALLGLMYAGGYGVHEDNAGAERWLAKAIEKVPLVPILHRQLGRVLAAQGNLAGARRELEIAFKLDPNPDPTELYDLGLVDEQLGDQLAAARAMELAFKRCREAADRDNSDAEFHLGLMYDKGYGVSKDSREALKWYRKAAADGSEDAKRALQSPKSLP
jgi:TPR repeat protein